MTLPELEKICKAVQTGCCLSTFAWKTNNTGKGEMIAEVRLRAHHQLVTSLFAVSCLQLAIASAPAASGPKGHLKKLGSHRPSEGFVPELKEVPHPIDFYEKYLDTGVPVVLRAAAKSMPAFRLWSDQYLREKAGGVDVTVVEGKKATLGQESGEASSKRTLSDFLDNYSTSDIGISSRLPDELKGRLQLCVHGIFDYGRI